MPYLIDGNNFLGHISPSSLRDPRSRKNLISRLLVFQKRKRTRVLVVFDGTPDLDSSDKKHQKKKFSIIYPPPGEKADGTIKEIISTQTDLRRFFVVSSDREIRSFARAKGAKSLSSKEFSRELKAALKEDKSLQDLEKKVKSLSPLEVDHWLKIFKGKK